MSMMLYQGATGLISIPLPPHAVAAPRTTAFYQIFINFITPFRGGQRAAAAFYFGDP